LELAMQAQAHLAAQLALPHGWCPCHARIALTARSVAYQNDVLPLNLPAVAIEAAQPDFWRKYVGRSGKVVGMPGFGESAPAKDLYAHFGITANAVVQAVAELLEGCRSECDDEAL
jgi:transketolase